jgi:hypothetical protein
MPPMPHLVLAITLTLLARQVVQAEQPVSLAVDEGHCECVISTAQKDDQFVLVVSSLATGGGPYPVRVHATATAAPERILKEAPLVDARWKARVADLAARQAKARQQSTLGEFTPQREPPAHKVFSLFIKDDDFENAAAYLAVNARLAGTGRYCQVYLDCDDGDQAGLAPTIDEVISTFDSQVKPSALGSVLDVDRDGRFTILLSGRLSRMQSGKVHLSGFVRGSDFYRDLAAPFGNRCDMMYLNTDLKPGAFLRGVVAHEFTHAVIFSEHVFGWYLPTALPEDEESWLNEAIAHVVEDQGGHGWANLDYRVSAFLSAPERYSLVVPDYYGRKLWRDPGSRGCAYLFLRWCVDRFGPELLTRLVRSNIKGIENLEVATQTPFAELFRQWTTALALSSTNLEMDGPALLKRFNLRGPLGERLLCGPLVEPMALSGADQTFEIGATAVKYLLLHSGGSPRTRLEISADPKAQLQVSLVRMPHGLPRLQLQCETTPDGQLRFVVTSHHAGVRLMAAAWEKLVTGDNAQDDTSYRCTETVAESAVDWFGRLELKPEETVRSRALAFPPGRDDMVVKVLGVDALGRKVAGWCIIHREQ